MSKGTNRPQQDIGGNTLSTLCVWQEVICPGGCETNPTPPQCSGTKQQQDPVDFPQGPSNPRARDNEKGFPHPKYRS